MDIIVIVVLGVLAIAAASLVGNRLGVAAPLLLVVAGIGVSLLPFVPVIEIEPEWILAGVLPPLLYSASVSMPSTNFRREFGAIGGLSVALVVISSVLVGLLFWWLIPGLGLWWSIALGAIVSPTDAVATSIVKKVGVSPRVVSILEGESLLNDATALVLLRTAIAGAAASVSLWGALGDFAFAVVVAVAIGGVVGVLNLLLRQRITDPTLATVISFTVPFIASLPAEHVGASGLVAAVVAGLVTGHGSARRLSPQQRLSDSQNWRAAELVLEGAVFLIMGLELFGLIEGMGDDDADIGVAVLVALAALVATVVVRAAFVLPLLAWLRATRARGVRMKSSLTDMQQLLDDPEAFAERLRRQNAGRRGRRGGGAGGDTVPGEAAVAGAAVEGTTVDGAAVEGAGRRAPSAGRIERIGTRIRRVLADIDYFAAAPLTWRDGSVVVWAGMRGAVTLAAAQTLPADTPQRSLLVFIAFVVAAASLLLQGGTLKRFVSWVKPSTGPGPAEQEEERARMFALLREAVQSVEQPADLARFRESAVRAAATGGAVTGSSATGGSSAEGPATGSPADGEVTDMDGPRPAYKKYALEVIAAQRAVLLDARDDGLFDSEMLNHALASLDADQIGIEMRGGADD
ncbi:cation:proton antiporter [Frigoribacterium sp. 2-23]|uniref:cation:proton antiporter n=1 Tax=Frigoribacterium sp. 2-23 TaxID=3415006 RepID=UPI003C6F7AE2